MTNILKPVRGEDYTIQVGNTTAVANSIVWSEPTVLNTSRSFAFKTNLQEDLLPDLDDLAKPFQKIASVESIDYTVSGSGAIDARDQTLWHDWLASGESKPVRFGQYASGSLDPWQYQGEYFLTDYSVSGDVHKLSTATITLTPASAVTRNKPPITNTTTSI